MLPARPIRSFAVLLTLVACTVDSDPQPGGFGTSPGPGSDTLSDGGTDAGTDASTDTGNTSSDTADAETGTDASVTGDVETSAAEGTTGADACSPATCPAPSSCRDDECVAPQKPAPGEVIIVELMIDPVTLSDNFAEWIEVLNVSASAVDLTGCRLLDLGVNVDDHLIDPGAPLVLLPGELMLLGKSMSATDNGAIPIEYAYGEFGVSLTNTGDDLILRCDDVDVDQVGWSPDAWPYDTGVAMQLDPAMQRGGANDAATAWCAATNVYSAGNTGTPGAANTPCP
jgi:hypothetical protein